MTTDQVSLVLGESAVAAAKAWLPSLKAIDRRWRDRVPDWERIFPGLIGLLGMQTLLWPHWALTTGQSAAGDALPDEGDQLWRFAFTPVKSNVAWALMAGRGLADWQSSLAALSADDVRKSIATLTTDGRVIYYGQAGARLAPLQGHVGYGDRPLGLPVCRCEMVAEIFPDWRDSVAAVLPILDALSARLTELNLQVDSTRAFGLLASGIWGELVDSGCCVVAASPAKRRLFGFGKPRPRLFSGALALYGDHYALWENLTTAASLSPAKPQPAELAVLPGDKVQAYFADYWPTDGWRKAPPETVGLDPVRMKSLLKELRSNHGCVSCMIVRHGYVAAEYYRDGADDLQLIHSVTKSFISALAGIAISKGLLKGADQPLTDFFPELNGPQVHPFLRQVKLEHLLTMTSGLRESPAAVGDLSGFGPYLASMKPEAEPGRVNKYSSLDAHLVGVILTKVAGTDLLTFARQYLCGPVGIREIAWPIDLAGIRTGASGMMLRTEDLAKLGYLYLRRGLWDGQQLIPEAWVAESTRAHVIQSDTVSRYGYFWWLHAKKNWGPNDFKAGNFWALGAGGQVVYVAPADDLVAVFCTMFSDESDKAFQLINQYVLPAVKR